MAADNSLPRNFLQTRSAETGVAVRDPIRVTTTVGLVHATIGLGKICVGKFIHFSLPDRLNVP
jgi:hypothetical protein